MGYAGLLANYRNAGADQQNALINSRVNVGNMPGAWQNFNNTLSGIGSIAGGITGLGGLFGGGGGQTNSGQSTGTSMSGYRYNNPYMYMPSNNTPLMNPGNAPVMRS
jgi:hypothetical protein